jgi:DNA-binding NarL/FixJ family response regulator
MEDKKEIIRILIVDDIPDCREYLAHLLHTEKYIEVVGMASTGKEAVKDYECLLPDIMITCIYMPDMDGIEATSIITKNHPNAQVIINSVQNSPDYMRRAMQAGAQYFIPKPATKDELMEPIRVIIRNNKWVVSDIDNSYNKNNLSLSPKPESYTKSNDLLESNKPLETDQLLRMLEYSNKNNNQNIYKRKTIKKSPKIKEHPSYVRLYHGPLVKWSTYLRIKKSDHDWDMAALTIVIIIIIVIIILAISK